MTGHFTSYENRTDHELATLWARAVDSGPGAREPAAGDEAGTSQQGSVAGVDGLDIDQTAALLKTHWSAIRDSLLKGTYRPQPVRRVVISKPGGGERELGIPTVMDRLIQQALLQVLQPILDPTFSSHSYGFRPGRSAYDAVRAAQSFVQSGRRVVVDVDLEKFFDRVDQRLYGRLHLTVNEAKSAVASVFGRKFLGYACWVGPGGVVK